ncbi:hypothetical protein [Roseateles sp. P5_D6]
MKKNLIATLVLAASCGIAAADAAWDASELAWASNYFGIRVFKRQNLHEADKFPDGARGRSMALVAHPIRSSEKRNSFKNLDEQYLHDDVCGVDGVVVAKAGIPVSALTADKADIITKTPFTITRKLKGNASFDPGKTVNVLRQGGEVSDQGEPLRVLNTYGTHFNDGSTYLLLLRRVAISDRFADYVSQGESLEVDGGRLHAAKGKWYHINHGDDSQAGLDSIERILSAEACPNGDGAAK